MNFLRNSFFKNNKTSLILTLGIFLLVVLGVRSNILEKKAIDYSKLPEKVEESRGFQRWITNLKNKGLNVTADEFTLDEEVEIYNTKWMQVYSIENEEKNAEYEQLLVDLQDTKHVIFSPSERLFIDYRNIERNGYKSNEVHFYGQKEDKIIDARILDCSVRANCYFDRAYFLDNDVFVISEFSRNINKDDPDVAICPSNELCTYTIKVHVIDLIQNSRLIYESNEFEIILDDLIPEL